MLIPVCDKAFNLAAQVTHRGERTAPEGALGDKSERTLDVIEPRAVGRRVVEMEARAAREPSLHFGMLVRAIVVNDQMHIEPRRHAGIEMAQKAQALLMAMAWFALGEHPPVGDVEGGKQCGSSVAVIIMRDAFDIAKSKGQYRLGALKGLDLALLIDAQHQGLVRRIEVQTDDVTHLLDKEGVGGELEAFASVRLHSEESQVALHAALRHAGFRRQAAHAPVRGGLRLALQDGVQQFGDAFLINAARSSWLELVVQSFH